MQLSVHQKLASLSEARAPPEASRKRKMEMDQGFVEADVKSTCGLHVGLWGVDQQADELLAWECFALFFAINSF